MSLDVMGSSPSPRTTMEGQPWQMPGAHWKCDGTREGVWIMPTTFRQYGERTDRVVGVRLKRNGTEGCEDRVRPLSASMEGELVRWRASFRKRVGLKGLRFDSLLLPPVWNQQPVRLPDPPAKRSAPFGAFGSCPSGSAASVVAMVGRALGKREMPGQYRPEAPDKGKHSSRRTVNPCSRSSTAESRRPITARRLFDPVREYQIVHR